MFSLRLVPDEKRRTILPIEINPRVPVLQALASKSNRISQLPKIATKLSDWLPLDELKNNQITNPTIDPQYLF